MPNKNMSIEEKNKVYGLFYGLLTLGFCVSWWISKEDNYVLIKEWWVFPRPARIDVKDVN